MNPVLVVCLSLSVLTGLAAAAWVVLAGMGWLAAFAAYSAAGSLSLIALTVAAQPGARTSIPAKTRR